ncbi:MAG: M20 family metallopeptidase [Candidatus Omnitrophota bacterium]
MINKERLIKLTRKLISINSENPPGNEARIAAFVKAYLRKLGLEAKIYAFKNRRSNIVAKLRGSNTGHSLLITPHLDTVPRGKSWKIDAFSGVIKDKRLYGLGATDCKCNLACSLEVINSLVEEKRVLGYNLILAATADEESGSGLGLIPLLEKGILKADAALVLDSDEFEIVITQKGLMHLLLIIRGKRAHGAYPWLGTNAIDIAVKILAELKNFKFSRLQNKYLRPPTINTGTIKGGDKVNIVADYCEVELDFRFLPGDSGKELLRKLKARVAKYAQDYKIKIEGIQKPYFISESHALVKALKKALVKFRIAPQVKGSEGATVITFFQSKAIPAVAFGFGTSGRAHTADEYVEIDNLYKGAQVLEEFLKNYKF